MNDLQSIHITWSIYFWYTDKSNYIILTVFVKAGGFRKIMFAKNLPCLLRIYIVSYGISHPYILGIFWQIDTRLSKLYDNTVKMYAVSTVY